MKLLIMSLALVVLIAIGVFLGLAVLTANDEDPCQNSSSLAVYGICTRFQTCEDLFGDEGPLYDDCFSQVVVDTLSGS